MNKSGIQLSAALLGFIVLIIFVLTLKPFHLAMPEGIHFTTKSSIRNLMGNIILFLPLGFIYRLATGRRGAFFLGAIISIVIETVQIFIPTRNPSIVDILTNSIGAGLGELLHDRISARIALSQRMVGRLRLETPHMGLVYLLMSLLWMDSLTLRGAPDRWILIIPLCLCGTIVLSELFRNWWKTVDYRNVIYASIAMGIWFYLGASPILRRQKSILLIGLGGMILTAILTALPQHSKDRRFEHIIFKKTFPFLILYLVLLALWNPLRPLTVWHWSIGHTNLLSEMSLRNLGPRIEYILAFTVLGFIFAEWHGRSEIPLRKDLPRLFLWAAGTSLVLEFIAGFQLGPGASLIRGMMVVPSAIFGGTIYHLLREHIRFLLRN